jgi:hypothetical protein
MDNFEDSSSFSFGNLIPSSLFENSYVMYSLIVIILAGVSYLAYKYYLNKNGSIGSTNIDYLQQPDENYEQQNVAQENSE